MNLTQTHARFEETSYTLIHALGDDSKSRSAAEELTRIYWPPVYAFLRHSGRNRDEAAELTQGFFCDKVFGNGLFERADPKEGRLRSLLLSALKRDAIDTHRKAVTRGKGKLIPMESIVAEDKALGTLEPKDAEHAFDARWSDVQLAEAMRRCEAHYRSTGRARHWEAFADRVYHPIIHNTAPTPFKTLAPKLGFNTPADAASASQCHSANASPR